MKDVFLSASRLNHNFYQQTRSTTLSEIEKKMFLFLAKLRKLKQKSQNSNEFRY